MTTAFLNGGQNFIVSPWSNRIHGSHGHLSSTFLKEKGLTQSKPDSSPKVSKKINHSCSSGRRELSILRSQNCDIHGTPSTGKYQE
jgi:hypothetical protein